MSEQTVVKTAQETVLNGVNVTQLFDILEAIKENGEIAKCELRASNEWLDGSRNRSKINGFYGALEEHTREKDGGWEND